VIISRFLFDGLVFDAITFGRRWRSIANEGKNFASACVRCWLRRDQAEYW
jgi:hypothetical protein